MTPSEAASLIDQPTGERIYLRGNFKVFAMGDNKAVLRPHKDPGMAEGAMRVIAEFPDGSLPPSEGSTVARDTARPFQVMQVYRGADGQINVVVREVTR